MSKSWGAGRRRRGPNLKRVNEPLRAGESVEFFRDSTLRAPQPALSGPISGTYVGAHRSAEGWHWCETTGGERVFVPACRIRRTFSRARAAARKG